MGIKICSFCFLLAVALFIDVFSDVVILKNGRSLEGIVSREGTDYVIETDTWKITIPEDEVKNVETKPYPLIEFREKFSKLDPQDAEGFYKLGLWAKDNGLYKSARGCFEKVLSINENHEGARKELGYEKYQNNWLTHDEVMVLKGFIKYEGKWITKEEAELLKTLAEKEKLENEIRLKELELKEKELAQKAEEERLKKELEYKYAREREERENYLNRGSTYGTYFYWGYYSPSPYWYYYYPYRYYDRGGLKIYYKSPRWQIYYYYPTPPYSASPSQVYVETDSYGVEYWRRNGTIIHYSLDGHFTRREYSGGYETIYHYPNSSGSGSPDFWIRR